MAGIGDNVRRMRIERNWTQLELSEISGVGEDYLSAIERGVRTPGKKILTQLCEAFGVDELTIRFGERKEKAPANNKLELALEEFEKAFAKEESTEDQLALVSELFAMLAKRRKAE